MVLCLARTAWLGPKFFETFTRLVVKVYNLCRVKTDISAVLAVMSGLDPHMIIELEDDLNRCLLFVMLCYLLHMLILWVNGINLYLVNAC